MDLLIGSLFNQSYKYLHFTFFAFSILFLCAKISVLSNFLLGSFKSYSTAYYIRVITYIYLCHIHLSFTYIYLCHILLSFIIYIYIIIYQYIYIQICNAFIKNRIFEFLIIIVVKI